MTNSWGNDPTAETKCPNVIKIKLSFRRFYDSFVMDDTCKWYGTNK